MEGVYSRRWLALGVLCLSLLLVVMANTSLIVAAPSMTRDMQLTSSQLQWVIDGYTIPYAALLLVFGAIGDRYSRRGALVSGLVLFAAGSAFGGLVHTPGLVIAARAVMGLGAAAIMPATLSLLVATFPRAERTHAIIAWSATSGLALALGPLLSGVLLRSHAWGSTFLINIPIAAVVVVAAFVLVPPSRAKHHIQLDLVGGLLSIVTVASLIYAIIQGLNFGWGAGPVAGIVIAAVGFCLFTAWELHHPRPIIDFARFRDHHFSGAMLAVLIFFFGVFGAVYYCTQHLQFVLGFDPLETGVRMLPLAGAVFVGAGVTGPLTRRLGAGLAIPIGMVIGTVGVLLLTGIGSGSSYSSFVISFVLIGAGIGVSLSPCTDTIMGLFAEHELGVAGGLNDTALELGGALGVAILGSVLNTSYRGHLSAALGHQLPAQALATARSSVGEALAIAPQIARAGGAHLAQAYVAVVNRSFAHAVDHTSVVAGIILAAGMLLVLAVFQSARRSHRHAGAPGNGTAAS